MRLSTFILVCVLLCASCGSSRIWETGGTKKDKDYELGTYYSGCCGCVASWYSMFEGAFITTQLIAETACGEGPPTLFQITRDSKGEVTEVRKYVAVSDSTATYPFGQKERMLLMKLDSIMLAQSGNRVPTFKFSSLVGYRDGRKDERFHPFWFDEKRREQYVTTGTNKQL